MPERISVTAAELKELWFSPLADGMIHDHQTQQVVVHMSDGRLYACTFAEHAALAEKESSDG